MITIQDVKQANRMWFGDGNKKFFGDVNYSVVCSVSGKSYLLRSTYGWSDMFGKKRKFHWRLNLLDDVLKIGLLIDDVFSDLDDVEHWLEEN